MNILKLYGRKNIIWLAYVFQIYTKAGIIGFFKGLGARVLYSMPATAICWSTYEFFKFVLSSKSKDNYRNVRTDAELYVIPKPPVIAELNTTAVMDNCSPHQNTLESSISGSQRVSEPATSRFDVGVYTAINMKPMHTERVFDPSIGGCNR